LSSRGARWRPPNLQPLAGRRRTLVKPSGSVVDSARTLSAARPAGAARRGPVRPADRSALGRLASGDCIPHKAWGGGAGSRWHGRGKIWAAVSGYIGCPPTAPPPQPPPTAPPPTQPSNPSPLNSRIPAPTSTPGSACGSVTIWRWAKSEARRAGGPGERVERGSGWSGDRGSGGAGGALPPRHLPHLLLPHHAHLHLPHLLCRDGAVAPRRGGPGAWEAPPPPHLQD
jgi:hypothetical protein